MHDQLQACPTISLKRSLYAFEEALASRDIGVRLASSTCVVPTKPV